MWQNSSPIYSFIPIYYYIFSMLKYFLREEEEEPTEAMENIIK
jgi:hypothetical protein